MKTPRFFCDAVLTPCSVGPLPKAVAHHVRVRRLKAGEQVVLFDGSGQEFLAELSFAADGTCLAHIGSGQTVDRERRGHLTLVQALSSQDRMDWVIEKAVELGVGAVIVTPAARSVVKLSADRASKRQHHWQGIVQSASEQCGRNRLMGVRITGSLAQALGLLEGTPKLLFTPEASAGLNDPGLLQQLRETGKAACFIGPEGGWNRSEQDQIIRQAATRVNLGPRVLRTETAGLFATACLTTHLDW